MKTKQFIFQWLLLLACLAARADSAVGWSTNLSQALQLGRQQNKPVLVDFSATWCGPCKRMALTTLKDEAVLQALQKFECVAVDIDQQPETAKTHGVNSVPTFLLLHSDGDEVARISGYMDAERFLAWLNETTRQFAAAQERKRQFQVQQQQLRTLLSAADTATRQEAVKQLFDLCSQRGQSEPAYAIAQFKEIARREPTLLLDGLNHSDLSTRIHVANALRAKFGDPFQFDPWEKPAARQSALAELRRQLTELEDPGLKR